MLTTGHGDERTKIFTAMHPPDFLHRSLIPSNDGIHILLSISTIWRGHYKGAKRFILKKCTRRVADEKKIN